MVARVTNSMISNTLMFNLNNNLRRVDGLQNQLSSGLRHANISDDPTSLIFGQAARNRMTRVMHYQEMVGVSRNWLTQAETGIMELNGVISAVYEELVSAGSVKTDEDKRNLAQVVGQLKNHFVDTLNTSIGDRFVFSGFNTPGDFTSARSGDGVRPFVLNENGDLLFNGLNTSIFDGMPARLLHNDFSGMQPQEILDRINDLGLSGEMNDFLANNFDASTDPLDFAANLGLLHNMMADVKSLDIGPGITMPITVNGLNVLFNTVICHETNAPIVRNMFNSIQDIFHSLNGTPERATIPSDPTTSPPTLGRPARPSEPPQTTDDLTSQIRIAQGAQNHLLDLTAEIGGRQRRLDLLDARYERDLINFGEMRSDAEDACIAEVIMNMRMAETVYQAALAAGARVIQPTLMDFLR